MSAIREFVRESNRIEGIVREPTEEELAAHREMWLRPMMLVAYVEHFVRRVADAPVRDKPGMNVIVGRHRPISGGPLVRDALGGLLDAINDGRDAYSSHIAYEQLHPFMDGNGRSGRAIWAWQMKRDGLDPFSLPFLHRFYYQTLDASRA